jgi:kynureninase
MIFKNSRAFAQQCDKKDSLSSFRKEFLLPTDTQGNELIYLCGNSLGLQPLKTKDYIQQELNDWGKHGVEGHTIAKNPWLPYHEFLTQNMAAIVGAKPSEVVVMNTLTTNLHLMMVSFYQPTEKNIKL